MCYPSRRASPDGQSFRSLGDETPAEFRRKQDSGKHSGGHDSDDDDDYENVRYTEVNLYCGLPNYCMYVLLLALCDLERL